MLNIEHLSVTLGSKTILNDFSLSLAQGEILCLLGPSGCGKTTALKAIAGLVESQQGDINLFGDVIKQGQYEQPPEARGMGFIFQDYALFPHMTVAQNIAFGLKGQSQQAIRAAVDEVLALVHLQGLGERYPHQLSGGQQQRTAVARALAAKPKLLLMDEPFSNIDSQVKHALMAELRGILKAHNITCILVTHAKYEAFAFADKTAVINQGRVEQVGSTRAVFETPANLFVAEFMESGNLLAVDKAPTSLFAKKPKVPSHAKSHSLSSAQTHSPSNPQGHWLLTETGFDLDAHQGLMVEVKDSLYMGHRYRNVLAWQDWIFHVESLAPLNVNEHLLVQYTQNPVWVP